VLKRVTKRVTFPISIVAGYTRMPDPASSPRLLNGCCLCGAARYQVADAFEYAMNCHCSQCRRATGAAFKPFAGIACEKLARNDAPVLIHGDANAAHDVHCAACGSLLYSVVRENTYVHVTLGTLTDTPSIRPTMHIFVGSKAPWHTITDDLPQWAEFPNM
jgi:hypothetical protein